MKGLVEVYTVPCSKRLSCIDSFNHRRNPLRGLCYHPSVYTQGEGETEAQGDSTACPTSLPKLGVELGRGPRQVTQDH